ncbi:MAG: NERD domain-containing protein [Deltaproteobacteria bacterium]|nr:NERD domain-containing protein [Deltaproteobacteria bacterium]
MAAMIPPDPPAPDEAPGSEIHVYRILERNLPDSWTVHHSFKWLHRDRRGVPLRSDIDFLALHPVHGILCIEVKGGLSRYDAEEDRWYRSTPDGEEALARSPVQQARLGREALFGLLRSHRRWNDRWVTIGHAVCTPDRTFEKGFRTSDMPRSILIDEGDLLDVEASLRRALDAHRHPSRAGKPGRDIAEIVSSVRGETRTFHSRLGNALAHDDHTITYLTDRQLDALTRTDGNPRMAFAGCAGSGKTFLAIEEAMRLARADRRVVLTCYNKPLEQFLRRRLEGEPGIMVRTFHSLCLGFARRASIPVPDRPPSRDAEEYWSRALPEAFCKAMEVLTDRFDCVIVDEGQDFRPEWWLPLEMLVEREPDGKGSFFVFYDDNQALYRHEGWCLPDDPMFRYHLDENLRNTRSIHEALLSYYRRTEGGAPVAIGPQGRPIEIVRYKERRNLVPTLKKTLTRLVVNQGVPPGEIVVLTPHGTDSPVYRIPHVGDIPLARDRNEQGVTVQTPSDSVLVTSIFRFKGLERQLVVLVETEDIRPDRRDEMLYVGGSRARGHLVVVERSR